MHGQYLASANGRVAYLILGVSGCVSPVPAATDEYFGTLILTVERVPRVEAFAGDNRVHEIIWDRRERRRHG